MTEDCEEFTTLEDYPTRGLLDRVVDLYAGTNVLWALLLLALTAAAFAGSLFIGRYPVAPGDIVAILASLVFPVEPTWNCIQETVILKIRLPRVLAAMLVGGGLAISGASFQGLFKNPLVSAQILGVASGAGFGAALGLLFSGGPLLVQGLAFVFGIVAVLLTYFLSRVYRATNTLVLVLAGIIVGALFQALISMVKYVADPNDTLPAIVFWLMGSLGSVHLADLAMVAPPMLAGMFVLLLIRWRINLLAVGDEEAKALGVDTGRLSAVIIVCATVITACAVCISGIIGWVGLVIPHIGRMLVGPDYQKLLPVSIILGAVYLLVIDDLSRTAMVTEIPLGILTAIIGVPFFAMLLYRRKIGWL
jgi:iron complex transport system permease protein